MDDIQDTAIPSLTVDEEYVKNNLEISFRFYVKHFILFSSSLFICRYYAIIHPLKAKYRCTLSLAKRTVICIWVSSFLLASPTAVGQVSNGLNANTYSKYALPYRNSQYWHMSICAFI